MTAWHREMIVYGMLRELEEVAYARGTLVVGKLQGAAGWRGAVRSTSVDLQPFPNVLVHYVGPFPQEPWVAEKRGWPAGRRNGDDILTIFLVGGRESVGDRATSDERWS